MAGPCKGGDTSFCGPHRSLAPVACCPTTGANPSVFITRILPHFEVWLPEKPSRSIHTAAHRPAFSRGIRFPFVICLPSQKRHIYFSQTRNKKSTFSAALELSGTPLPYFPEMIPQASGDHVIAPTPAEKTEEEIFRGLGEIRVVSKPGLSVKKIKAKQSLLVSIAAGSDVQLESSRKMLLMPLRGTD